jgi:hypothetical protein
VIAALTPKIIASQAPQLFINQRHQLRDGRGIASAPGVQDAGDIEPRRRMIRFLRCDHPPILRFPQTRGELFLRRHAPLERGTATWLIEVFNLLALRLTAQDFPTAKSCRFTSVAFFDAAFRYHKVG